MARITKAQAQAIQAARAEHFTIGNVIYSKSWQEHDLVVDFQAVDAHTWSVVVKRVELVDGEWVSVDRPRAHCTEPHRADVVVAIGVAA